jgi:hypothetical protein
MDILRLQRLASRIAQVGQAPEQDQLGFIHMNLNDPNDTGWDPNGEYATAFGAVISQAGGDIPDWEGEWLEIHCPMSEIDKFKKLLEECEAGTHGPEAQLVAQKYSISDEGAVEE